MSQFVHSTIRPALRYVSGSLRLSQSALGSIHSGETRPETYRKARSPVALMSSASRAARQIDDRGAQTLGADVQSQEIGRVVHAGAPVEVTPESVVPPARRYRAIGPFEE